MKSLDLWRAAIFIMNNFGYFEVYYIISFLLTYRVSHWNGTYELALTDKDIQVGFGLKMVLESWVREFLVTTTIFQKSNIGWPQQPPTERISDSSKKLDFWRKIPQKGPSIGCFGARDDLTIRIRKIFGENGFLRL